MPKHLMRRSKVSTLLPSRFVVLWVAEIRVWRGESEQVFRLLGEAVRALPQQSCIVAGDYEMDERSLLFRIVAETPTVTTAKACAIRGLREALLGVGVGLERSSAWAPLILELDPGLLDARRLVATSRGREGDRSASPSSTSASASPTRSWAQDGRWEGHFARMGDVVGLGALAASTQCFLSVYVCPVALGGAV